MEERVGSEMYRLIWITITRNNGNLWYECELTPFHSVNTQSWDEIRRAIDRYWDNFVTFERK